MKILRRLLTTVLCALVTLLAARTSDAAEYNQRLINLSSLGTAGSGNNVMIAGFVINGDVAKKVLIRAVGPGLTTFGVHGTLANPTIKLYDDKGNVLGANDHWSDNDAATMSSVGAFPLTSGSGDSALVTTLPPGLYSAVVSAPVGTSGIAMIEIYDVTGSARLMNISTRAPIGTGASTLVAGLVVASGGTRHVLVRAAGPSLSDFGVSNAHPDPVLTLFDAAGHVLASNDNWETNDTSAIATATSQAGAFAFKAGSKDAALIADLPPGNYSIHVDAGVSASGVALAEVYDITPPAPTTADGSPALYIAYLHSSSGNSSAYGIATLSVSSDGQHASINVSFGNLSSPEVVAHVSIDGTFIRGLPQGQVNQTTWNFAPVGTYGVADIIAALKAGRVSVQIDTQLNPNGELIGAFIPSSSTVFSVPPAAQTIDVSNPSDADAARFLTQTTFGPTTASIADVKQKGFSAWLDAQMAVAPSSQASTLMADFAASNVGGQGTPVNGVYPYPGGVHRQAAWWKIAVTGQDQLRQRVAFALSEIFVASDQDPFVNTWQQGFADYYDVLAQNAFGNFRDLLEKVTLHPIMGVYLSMIRNGKATYDGTGMQLSSANENYAREIMQLFTIGLYDLNPDGTLKIDLNGQPVPTYDQNTIVDTAKVFTGWAFYSTDANPDFHFTGGNRPEDWMHPMMLYPAYHDTSAKTLVGGVSIPAGQGGAQDLKTTLDTLFNHPNTGPFICKQLIQRLVTSNPSPAYVYRVAQVFANNGQGVRGDMAAVVKAIFMDYEARSPSLIGQASNGKLKEPLLRATALFRAFGAKSDSGRLNIDAYPSFAQAAGRSPTVFNFFSPSFSRPGAIAASGLVAPEFQIATDTSAITGANFFHFYLYNPKPQIPSADNRDSIYFEYTDLLPLAGTPQVLLDRINLLLCANSMSAATNNRIVAAINAMPNNNDIDRYERVRAALYLTVTSPDGSIQL